MTDSPSTWSGLARPLLLVLAAGSLWLAGCQRGAKKVEVQGTVTYDSQPIGQGTIALTPIQETRGPQVGGPIEEGKYHLRDKAAPLAGGVYRVEITNIVPSGRKINASGNPAIAPAELMHSTLPDCYNTQSTLILEVPRDVETLKQDFDLPP